MEEVVLRTRGGDPRDSDCLSREEVILRTLEGDITQLRTNSGRIKSNQG
jgi:hypothetical protein